MKTTLTTAILILFTQFCLAQPNTDLPEDFWIELEKPTGGMVFSLAVNSITEVYAGMGNGVYLSNDDSNSWTLTGLEGITSYSLHIHQNGNVFAGTGGFNSLYRLKDIGEGWEPLLPGNLGNIISITNSRNGDLFVGNWGEIYKSLDYGETWNKVLELDNTQVIEAITENPDGVLFAGVTAFFGGGGVYRSTDNGDTWEHVGLNNKYISSIAINSTGVLFAGSRGDHEYGGGGVFRSDDNGITWDEVAYNVWVTSMAIDPNDVLYIGCTNGVFRSSDNGESWERIVTGMGLYTSVEGMSLSPNGYLYAYDNKLFRSTKPVFITNTTPNSDTGYVKVFPNPFTDILHIELPIEQLVHGPLLVKVFELTGRQIFSQNLSNLQGINLSSILPGLYYISIEINGQRLTKPIVKL